MHAITEIFQLTDALLWQGFAVFLRVSALVSLLPAFGAQAVPARIKLGIALAFTLIVAPAIDPPLEDMKSEIIFWIIITEITSGVIIGIGIRLFILALQTAGSIAAQSTSLAQVLGLSLIHI